VHANGDDAIVTARGAALLGELGADVPAGSVSGGCVDLTERRLHLRGRFAKELLRGASELGWIERARGRELRVTPLGRDAFRTRFGIAVPA
jgi:hypothetical protein